MVAINKRWNGSTSGDVNAIANWDKVSLRSADFQWTASGSGTNEFYLQAAGGGDPGVLEPPELYLAGALATAGTAGSLTAGQWDYADNDTLGFSTIYVRLSDGADPDSKTTGYVELLDRVRAGDYVRVPAGSNAMSSNVDLSATTVNSWIFEEGYTKNVATATAYLKLSITNTTGIFRSGGSGRMFVDLGSSQVAPVITAAASGSNGQQGLNLRGTGLSTLTVERGDVGLASLHGEKSTVTTIRVLGGLVVIGAGVTLTTLEQHGGLVVQRASATTANIYGGSHRQEEAAANTTLNVYDDAVSLKASSGTNATVNLNGGIFEGRFGTTTTLNHHRAGAIFRHYPSHTLTTYNVPTAPYELESRPL